MNTENISQDLKEFDGKISHVGDVSLKKNMSMVTEPVMFDGGSFKLLDYSPVDEDLLLAQFGISGDETMSDNESLSLVTAHTFLTLRLDVAEYIYFSLLEKMFLGDVKLGKLTRISNSSTDWMSFKSVRKSSPQSRKASIPSLEIKDPELGLKEIAQLQDFSEKSLSKLNELGMCEKQISLLAPKTRIVSYAWTLSLKDVISVINLVDDESLVWELRSLGLKLKQAISKLFPSLASEYIY